MYTKEASKIRKAWDGIAVNFDRYVTPTANWDWAKTALCLAGLEPGMHFLDVASGSGALSLPAARVGARVLAVDISPLMIERLRARAEEERLTSLKGVVMDGQQLKLSDDVFDMAGSQFGVVLFPDFQRGLHEMVRVTRPGGIVFLVAFGPEQTAEFHDIFIQAVQEADPDFDGLSQNTNPLPFQAIDKSDLQEKMAEARLGNVWVAPVVHKLFFNSGKEMWNWVTSSDPIMTQMISHLDDRQKNRVGEILEQRIRERSFGQAPATLDVGVNIAIGEKVK